MDVKLVNPFIDAFTTVLPQMGFPTPERTGMGVQDKHINSRGVAVLVARMPRDVFVWLPVWVLL